MDFSIVNVFGDAGVAPQSLERLKAAVRAHTFDAGEFLIRQGEGAPNLFFIRNGLVKMFYITADGKEFTKSFIAEGQFSGSLAAQMGNGESTFSIVCLEPVEAEVIPYRVLEDLVEVDPAAQRFVCNFFKGLALKKEIREYEFLCLAPEERYRKFVEDNTSLAERVTQADIARYLGITPVALSRIRGRLKP